MSSQLRRNAENSWRAHRARKSAAPQVVERGAATRRDRADFGTGALGPAAFCWAGMNTTLLIDAIVRQTTVLIASLATASGQRAQLAHLAHQVFADLATALKEQGLGNKVIADMFGMALRTYHARMAKVSESRTEQGRSLWEAVLDDVQRHGPLLRAQVLAHFAQDDEASVRGVLRDLEESGLVARSGRGDAVMLQATQVSAAMAAAQDDTQLLDNLLWVAIYRHGPLQRQALRDLVPIDDDAALDAALERLTRSGTVSIAAAAHAGEPEYRCVTCVIGFGAAAGWEAALFDHYQALVLAIVAKLRAGQRRAELQDKIGGSTFTFELWRAHPMEAEVLGFLAHVRKAGIDLRARLDAYNAAHAASADESALRVIAYVGQSVMEAEPAETAG